VFPSPSADGPTAELLAAARRALDEYLAKDRTAERERCAILALDAATEPGYSIAASAASVCFAITLVEARRSFEELGQNAPGRALPFALVLTRSSLVIVASSISSSLESAVKTWLRDNAERSGWPTVLMQGPWVRLMVLADAPMV